MLVEKQIPLFQTLSLYSCNNTCRYDKYLQFNPKQRQFLGRFLIGTRCLGNIPCKCMLRHFYCVFLFLTHHQRAPNAVVAQQLFLQ